MIFNPFSVWRKKEEKFIAFTVLCLQVQFRRRGRFAAAWTLRMGGGEAVGADGILQLCLLGEIWEEEFDHG